MIRRLALMLAMPIAVVAVIAPSAQAALPAPKLETPGEGSAVQASPTLTWRQVTGAAQYVRSGKRVRAATVSRSGAGLKTLKRNKKTGKKGTTMLTLRPTRKGMITIKAARRGHVSATATIRVR